MPHDTPLISTIVAALVLAFLAVQVLIVLRVDPTAAWTWIAFGVFANGVIFCYPLLAGRLPIAFSGRANTSANFVSFLGAFLGQYAIGGVMDLFPRQPGGGYATAAYDYAFGGLLAGLILLAPADGWSFATEVLGDAKRPYSIRLSAIGTVRFLQSTRGADCKAEVLKCCAALLPHGDLADQAIEDLRRWGYWDLTTDVLAQFGKPTHAAPIVRRAIVRYALSAPGDEASRFVAAARQSDP